MSTIVHRFMVHACPAPLHPEYYSWQTAQLCLFVGDDDRDRALAIALAEIAKQQWLPIGPMQKQTVIEARVLDIPSEKLRSAYIEAKAGKVFFYPLLDQMPMATKTGSPFPKAPRIGEVFMDRVIVSAGGRRLTTDETDNGKIRNADYLLNDTVLELKDMQEEGLLVPTRQARLAQLLRGLAPGDDYARLSPSGLSEKQWREYIDILGRPIQNQVKSAAKQLKVSRGRLKCKRGAVIFLNTGYSSIPHELFVSIVRRYCTKDTQQVDFSVCISSWLITNGFDSKAFFALDPHEGGSDVESAIRESFWKEIETMMNYWGQSGFKEEGKMLQPIEPIAFRDGSQFFSTQPPMLPCELDKNWNREQ